MDTNRVAVLIDCDNISWQLGGAVLAEAAKQGTLGIKRGYGDWSSPHLSGWKRQLSLHAIQPMQLSADHRRDGPAVLGQRRRVLPRVERQRLHAAGDAAAGVESGRRVYGIGAQKTHVAFQNACDRFTFTEVLTKQPAGALALSGQDAAAVDAGIAELAPAEAAVADQRLDTSAVPDIKDILVPALVATARDDGWAPLSTVGTYIVNNHPSFDSRNYGFPRLGSLVRSLDFVEVKSVPGPDGSAHPWVCLKPDTTGT